MKPSRFDAMMKPTGRLLILSDRKPGHQNQSIAFARHLGCEFDLRTVRYRNRLAKALSYLLDWFGLYWSGLFLVDGTSGKYLAVVSAGSATYYANKTLARRLQAASVAIMLPKSYRLNFDMVVAQQHDDPPLRSNIVQLPINLTYIEPQGLVAPKSGQRYVSLVIGGDSGQGRMDCGLLKDQVMAIRELFPDHKFWMTTSRRTPLAVEEMLRGFRFERTFFYSEEPVNPIPDFLQYSDYVFITADSSSMISEAVSYGQACVEVLPLADDAGISGKFANLLKMLAEDDCLHVFNGTCKCSRNKVPLGALLKEGAAKILGGAPG